MRRRTTRWAALALTLSLGGASVAGSAEARPTIDDGPRPTVWFAPAVLSPSPPATTAAPAPLIVIDPGHSGTSIRSTTQHGLRDIDYPNSPEIYEVWDVSTCVGRALRLDGYRVTLTKRSALSSVGLARRAEIATDAKAALAVSVHDDHSQSSSFEATYSQRGVRHAGSYHAMYRGTGGHRTVFENPAVAKRSEADATKIAAARTTTQGRTVGVTENTFTGRPPLEPGNLALVQLLTDVPWVYNEMGARTDGSTTQAVSLGVETAYAEGLLSGIEASVPIKGRTKPSVEAAAGLRGCLVAQVGTKGHYSRPSRYLPSGWPG